MDDVRAFALTSVLMVIFVETVKAAAARGLSTQTARKCMHIGAGPIFLATWPLFSAGGAGARWCGVVPLTMTVKFALTGLGVLRGRQADADVRAMSRSGRRDELLRGPLLYGLVFCAMTALRWRRLDGAVALLAVCVGDGLAEPAGRRWGGGACKHGTTALARGRLPWSPRKSWAGLAACFVSSFAASVAAAARWHALGWHDEHAFSPRLLAGLARACAAGALAETVPWPDVDNLLVPLAVLAVGV